MTPKLWTVALIGGGLLLIFAGIQQWRTNQRPKETVVEFLEAVKLGDSEAALRLMTPELNEQAQSIGDDFASAWAGSEIADDDDSNLTYDIESVTVRGDQATAKTLFRHAGMPFVNSTIQLQLTKTGLWKIAHVENRINTAWQMLQNQQLAIELRNAFNDLSGVEVAEEPVPQRRWR